MRMATSDRKYRGMSREARREQRRRQFIEAGHALFGSEGYQAASVKKLCREAELTERYFYESFKRREDLFAACYDEKLDLLFTTLLENLTSGTRSVEQIVVDGLLSLFRTLRDDQHMARILMIEIYGVPYDQQRLYERSIGRFSDMLLQFMQRFLPAPPDDPDVDLELLATGLVGVCIQMAQRWVIKGYRQTPEQLAANCMLIFRGLGQQTGLLEQTISPAFSPA